MLPIKPKKYLLAILIPALMQQAIADDTTTTTEEETSDLGTLTVTATKPKTQGKLGEKIVTRKELTEQNIQNAHDLVRYNTEVDVAEVGRYGNKGFAIRGVDGNRVAMNIDGVGLPEVEVNEIFSPYGYMYEGRFNPDVEMMGSVRIAAGADSLVSGSGAVGGSVAYKTKEPSSMVKDGNLGGYAKVGYTTKNEELLSAVGLAGVYNKVEFLLNYAHRDGHETKSHGNPSADSSQLDPSYVFSPDDMPCVINRWGRCSYNTTKSLRYANPMEFKRDSALAKLNYNINDSHRIGIFGFYQNQKSLMNTSSMQSTGGPYDDETRRGHDKEEMKAYGLNYLYRPNLKFLEEVGVDISRSEVLGLADTWIYDRNLRCPDGSSWSCNDSEKKAANVELQNREYRPTNTITNQYGLNFKFTPVDFGKFGEHSLGLITKYNDVDYTQHAIYLSNLSYLKSHLAYAFPDAKKKFYNISLTDKIYFNDRLNAMLGLRYDNYKYSPYYQDDIDGYGSEKDAVAAPCKNATNNSLYCQLYRSGGSLSDTKYSHPSYSGMIDFAIIPERLTARYKIGTGFLMPTITQTYSSFQILGVRQVPNYNLKPEKSFNQELEFEFKPTTNTTLTLSGYISKYKDFIHTKYWSVNSSDTTDGCTNIAVSLCMQSVNLDEAEVKGVKIGVEADLSEKFKTDGRFSVFANYHTAKDSAIVETDKNGKLKINTLAATPTSLILGADYVSANNDWSVHGRIRGILGKKADDTKTLSVGSNKTTATTECPYSDWYACYSEDYTYDYSTGKYVKEDTKYDYYEYVSTYKHIDLSKTAVIYDLYGTKKFGKNKHWIVNAGIYNVTDVKYIPWESLRQFDNTSVNNMVDNDGYGFNRYTAPGRNYALSLTYEF